MKTKLFSLAVAVLGTPLLAHAVNPLTDGFCSHASDTAKTMINILLALWQQGPICRSTINVGAVFRPPRRECLSDGWPCP